MWLFWCLYGSKKTIVEGAHNKVSNNGCLILRDNALLVSCALKNNGTLIDKAQDLDVTMPMYNLIEYSKIYLKRSGTLWKFWIFWIQDNYYRKNSY